MKFYFDDSGSFSVTASAPHVIAGVLIPDVHETTFRDFHDQFVGTLETQEFKNGEPKGFLLREASRTRLFEFIGNNPWIRIAPVLTDSEFNDQTQIQGYRAEQVKLYEDHLRQGGDKQASEKLNKLQLDLLQATRDGISDVQFVKGLTLFYALYALLRNCTIIFQGREYDECWKGFEITLDKQDENIITPMEIWINNEFKHFIQEHASEDPIEIPLEWKERNHPFLDKFLDRTQDRFVLNRIFVGGFKFEDSKSHVGLHYADWIVNTLGQVFRRKRDRKFLEMLSSNLVGYGRTRIILTRIYRADTDGIRRKYGDFLYQ